MKLYVYPFVNPNGELVTAQNFDVAPNLAHLYKHLLENGFIEPLEGYNPSYLPIKSSEVLAKIRAGAGLGRDGFSRSREDNQRTPALWISVRVRRKAE